MAITILDADDLCSVLAELGDSPDQVAFNLRAAGITGACDDPGACPVAKWLERQVGGDAYVERRVVSVRLVPDALDVESPCPDAVRSFVARFDAFKYPDLVEDECPSVHSYEEAGA